MSILCAFIPHRWFWHVNARQSPSWTIGIYQCQRCKVISVGSPRDPDEPGEFLRTPECGNAQIPQEAK